MFRRSFGLSLSKESPTPNGQNVQPNSFPLLPRGHKEKISFLQRGGGVSAVPDAAMLAAGIFIAAAIACGFKIKRCDIGVALSGRERDIRSQRTVEARSCPPIYLGYFAKEWGGDAMFVAVVIIIAVLLGLISPILAIIFLLGAIVVYLATIAERLAVGRPERQLSLAAEATRRKETQTQQVSARKGLTAVGAFIAAIVALAVIASPPITHEAKQETPVTPHEVKQEKITKWLCFGTLVRDEGGYAVVYNKYDGITGEWHVRCNIAFGDKDRALRTCSVGHACSIDARVEECGREEDPHTHLGLRQCFNVTKVYAVSDNTGHGWDTGPILLPPGAEEAAPNAVTMTTWYALNKACRVLRDEYPCRELAKVSRELNEIGCVEQTGEIWTCKENTPKCTFTEAGTVCK